MTTGEPFGTYRLSPLRESIRRIGDVAPSNRIGRWLVSLVRRLALTGVQEPIDVTVARNLNLRLHPAGNRCEKRAVSGIHLWDAHERAALCAELDLRAVDGTRPFVFLDVGANVGLYSVTLGQEAQKRKLPVRIVAIEPDRTNAARLAANARFSHVAIEHLAVAIGEKSAFGRMSGGQINRGEVRFQATIASDQPEADTTDAIRMITLHQLCDQLFLDRIDALKLDIEGHDLAALRGFFETAPEALHPRLMIVELDGRASDLLALCERNGYEVSQRAGINAILRKAS